MFALHQGLGVAFCENDVDASIRAACGQVGAIATSPERLGNQPLEVLPRQATQIIDGACTAREAMTADGVLSGDESGENDHDAAENAERERVKVGASCNGGDSYCDGGPPRRERQKVD
ncbi:MAG TPA: hypothetical protein VI434_12370 [Candidatus Dormibacteraeota bacterium]